MRPLITLLLAPAIAATNACVPAASTTDTGKRVDITPNDPSAMHPATIPPPPPAPRPAQNPPPANPPPPQNPPPVTEPPPRMPERAPPVPGAPMPPVVTTTIPIYGSPYYAGVPGDNVQWLSWPVQQMRSIGMMGTVLLDIVDHLPPSYGTQFDDPDPILWAHETTYGITDELVNNHNTTGARANGFYVAHDRAALVVEPNIRKSEVAQFVPPSLQGSRFSVYITGQTSWDDTPTYIFEEWIAYTNGGATGVDLVSNDLWQGGWEDGVAGQLELTVYSIALAMAVERFDPQYFQTNAQFKELLAWQTKRAMAIYAQGSALPAFAFTGEDTYHRNLQTAPDAEPLRAFARRLFGQPWADAFFLGLVTPGGTPSGPDADHDGIPDAEDLCSNTPAGATVWTGGEWIGCSEGQHRDPARIPNDDDHDGVANSVDRCPSTPMGDPVWTSGEWIGCAEGEIRS